MIVFKQKIFNDDKKKKMPLATDIAVAGATAAGTLAADKISKSLLNKAGDYFDKYSKENKLNKKESEELYKKLTEIARKKGTRIIKDSEFNNAAYVGGDGGKLLKSFRKFLAHLKKTNKKAYEEFIEGLGGDSSRRVITNLGRDRIVMGKNFDDATVLSHEIGHSHMMRKGRSKDIVGKLSHKLLGTNLINKLSFQNNNKKVRGASLIGLTGAGYKSGKKAERLKSEGKKEGIGNKAVGYIGPALAAPLLVAEAAASRKGLKLLKRSGASKEYLKNSRKALAGAWGTYVSNAAPQIVASTGGRAVGRLTERQRIKKNKEKDEEK